MPFDGSVLAQVDPGRVSAGPLGLLVMLLMGLATVMLVRSMNGHLRKLPREFGHGPSSEGAADSSEDAVQSPSLPTGAPHDAGQHSPGG